MNASTLSLSDTTVLMQGVARPPRRAGMFPRGLIMAAVAAGLAIPQVSAVDLTPTITTRGDGYKVATFSTVGTGTWTVPAHTGNIEVLVVGGGGGSTGYGGGGGGGGFYHTASCSVATGTSVTVTVGVGGAGGPARPEPIGPYPQSAQGASGGDSVFDSLTSYGGQGGVWTWTASGVGHGWGGTSGGNNQGGVGITADHPAGSYSSGSGAGVKGTSGTDTAGGAGLPSAIITGSTAYYAGGGGALVNGPGGLGGGGAGHSGGDNNGYPGQANTGGGGGAGHTGLGAAGGSGVVIVAYQDPSITATTTELVSSDVTSIDDQSVMFTATVKVGAVTATAATGSVEFKIDDVAVVPPSDIVEGTGVATCIISNFSTGAHTVTATYSGNSTYATSTGGPLTQTNISPKMLTMDFGTYGAATIDGTNVSITVPFGTNLSLAPTYTFATGATGSPAPGATRNFTSSVPYTLTSTVDPLVTKEYLVTVTVAPYAALPVTYTTREDGYTLATFSESGQGGWTVPAGVTSVEVLVIGGGGGAGLYSGGGGGGGFVSLANYAVTPGSQVGVAVGAGGTGGDYRDDSGTYPNGTQAPSGGNSTFDSLISYGGQGGIFMWTSGGAGYGLGGASGNNNTNSVGGLAADWSPNVYGSGSGVGVKGTAAGAHNDAGGAGLSSLITGTLSWYGGGGGAQVNGPGGLGGGGAGGNPPGAGTANTGGGGGSGAGVNGGSGGSGVVIVAYLLGTATSTDLRSSDPSAHSGDNVTFTATVKVGGSVVPSLPGTVEFKVDGVVKTTVSINSDSGEATYSSTELPIGTYNVVATYSGVDGTYLASSATVSQTVDSTPFATWAQTNITAKQPGADARATGDPDGDGSNNLSEYAFYGDPLSGSDHAKAFCQVEESKSDPRGKELILTVAVRNDAPNFELNGNGLTRSATSASGGITYTIEGSDNLVFPGKQVTEVGDQSTDAMKALLPEGSGYGYRSFVLELGGLEGKGFLRAVVLK